MATDVGRSPSGRATHERSQSPLSPPTVSVPNAAPWWRCLHCGCDEFEEHVFTGHMRGVPMIHCANCQVLHSPPDPDSKTALRWMVSELAEALEHLLELQCFHDDREHWELEHKAGNGAAWRVLEAMDALDAIAAGTRRAETGETPAPSEGCQSGGAAASPKPSPMKECNNG